MTWRDELQRVSFNGRQLIGGSFRGVPFFVEDVDRSGGRRIVVHEFPRRDDPAIDDNGRKTRTLSYNAYVIGDDYLATKNELLSALEDIAGPGQLVDPYTRNAIRAHCSALTARESTAEGGMARFSIEFTIAPSVQVAAVESQDLLALVDLGATLAFDAIVLELEDSYSAETAPSFAIESLATDVVSLAAQLRTGLSAIVTLTQDLAALNVEILSIENSAISIVRKPRDVIEALARVLFAISDTIAEVPRNVLSALIDAYDIERPNDAIGDTETRITERANQAALGEGMRRFLIIEASRLIAQAQYVTLDEAVSDREAIVERIEGQLLTAGDESYAPLAQLRSAVQSAIPGDTALARVVTIYRSTAIPSLLLSYQVYGSTAQETDILERNDFQHPGFMVGEISTLSSP